LQGFSSDRSFAPFGHGARAASKKSGGKMFFKPMGPACQSCGMPLSKDPRGGGTNADGSKSSEYCSRCYEKGVFAQPNITAEEMTALVEAKLRSMHFPGFLARKWSKQVPTLRRWKNKSASSGAARASTPDLQPRA
jgi:hypothetical protein